jgi:DNA-binding transcriptional ArsR family regulator
LPGSTTDLQRAPAGATSRLVTKAEEGGHEYYRKTYLGEHLHKLLKSHEYVGSLFEELIRDRLR